MIYILSLIEFAFKCMGKKIHIVCVSKKKKKFTLFSIFHKLFC